MNFEKKPSPALKYFQEFLGTPLILKKNSFPSGLHEFQTELYPPWVMVISK
jgi:hypothetical protein